MCWLIRFEILGQRNAILPRISAALIARLILFARNAPHFAFFGAHPALYCARALTIFPCRLDLSPFPPPFCPQKQSQRALKRLRWSEIHHRRALPSLQTSPIPRRRPFLRLRRCCLYHKQSIQKYYTTVLIINSNSKNYMQTDSFTIISIFYFYSCL